jgi:hypothetical protein
VSASGAENQKRRPDPQWDLGILANRVGQIFPMTMKPKLRLSLEPPLFPVISVALPLETSAAATPSVLSYRVAP